MDPADQRLQGAVEALSAMARPVSRLRALLGERQAELHTLSLQHASAGSAADLTEQLAQTLGAIDRELAAILTGVERVALGLQQLHEVQARALATVDADDGGASDGGASA